MRQLTKRLAAWCFNSLLEMLALDDAVHSIETVEFQFSIGDARGALHPPPRNDSSIGFNSLLEMLFVGELIAYAIQLTVSILYWRCWVALLVGDAT